MSCSARHSGFAYLWMLFMVALIGVGLVVAGKLYALDQTRQRERELIFVGRQISDAIGRYYESSPQGMREYPPSLETLLQDSRFPQVKRHLRRLYVDPMTGRADWVTVQLGGRVIGVHSRSKGRPFKVSNFEPSESDFSDKEAYSDWVFLYGASGLKQSSMAAQK